MTAMLAGFSPDPRVNLAAGYADAGQAVLNMELLAALPKPAGFYDPENPEGLPTPRTDLEEEAEGGDGGGRRREPRPSLLNFGNTDMAFFGDILIAGNYHGFNIYDVSAPGTPELLSSVVCPGGQGDISVYRNLLFLSVQETRSQSRSNWSKSVRATTVAVTSITISS